MMPSLVGQAMRLPEALSAPFRLLDPSLRRRIANGATWSIVGAGIANALAMASTIASARFLGSTHYGELAIVLSTTNLFTTLFGAGLSMTATKYVAEHRDVDPRRAGTVIGLSSATALAVGAIVALLVMLLSPWASRDILRSPELAGALNLGAAAMFFAAVNGSQTGALSGLEAFDRIAIGNLVRGGATILLVTLGAAVGGVTGALWGYIGVGAATALYYQIAVRRECAAKAIVIGYRFDRQDLGILWRFTFPVLVTTFSFTPAAWWSNVLLAKTSGYAQAGVFNACFHWQLLIMFLSNAVSNVGLPMLSSLRAEGDGAKYKRCLTMNYLMTSIPAILIAVPVAIGSHFIVRLYGPAFRDGATALMLISFYAILSAINIPVGHALWSLNATRAAVWLALLNGIVLVTGAYALADRGAAGLAGAYVIMGLVQTAVNIPFMIWLLRREFTVVTKPQEVLV